MKVSRICSSLAAVALLLAAALPAPAQVAATVPKSLSLVPAVVILNAKFGQTVTQTIALQNLTDQGLAFEMTADDVVVKNGKRIYVPGGQLPGSIAASAVFSQRSGFIAAQTQKAVQVLLTVPPGTAIRAVAIYFKSKHVLVSHGTVSLNASIGSLVTFILTANSEVSAQAVRVRPPTESQNLKVDVRLDNVGTEPVVPEGVAAFIDAAGRLAAKTPFTAQRLLPGESLDFTAEYAGRLKRGTYRVLCTFSYAGKALTRTVEYRAP
jgi:hypothetical protein